MEIIETAWIPLPDGTRLAARLFLPDTRPCPAVLEYLPYRRRDVTAARDEGTYPAYAAAGIAGVRVDLRGTGDSEGAFDDEYSETELSDAEAVIAWIADQPWSNGNVGMMGISWGGFNALQLAARRPPALKAVISIASTVDRFNDDIHYKGGAMLGANLYWACQMLGRAALPPDAAVVGEDWRARWRERLNQTPSLAAKWHREQARGAYWQHGSVCEDFTAITLPCLVIAGWADGYRNTPWKARAGMGDAVRALTGPWVHHYPHYAEPGPSADFHGESIAWWHEHLSGGPKTNLPAHRLWLSEAVPPGPRKTEPGRWIAITQTQPAWQSATLTADHGLTLHCSPNTSPGGSISSNQAQASDPVPAATPQPNRHAPQATETRRGSATSQRGEAPRDTPPLKLKTPLHCGRDGGEYFTQSGQDLPGDQRADDGLSATFGTAPLSTPLDIIGMPALTLPLTIDAPQGHLIARLCDVHPDGRSHRITMGVLNLSHRDGSDHPKPMTPGKMETVTIQLDATAYRLRPGHRLRLALSTTYFPYILPPPTAVTATIDLAQAQLHLPSQAFEDIHIPEGRDSRPDHSSKTTSAPERWLETESLSGEVGVSVLSGSTEKQHPDHGMIWTDLRASHWEITGDDPLSLTGREHCSGIRTRDGVKTEVQASAQMHVTATHWQITTRLRAFEDDTEIFDREWRDDIPRDHG